MRLAGTPAPSRRAEVKTHETPKTCDPFALFLRVALAAASAGWLLPQASQELRDQFSSIEEEKRELTDRYVSVDRQHSDPYMAPDKGASHVSHDEPC